MKIEELNECKPKQLYMQDSIWHLLETWRKAEERRLGKRFGAGKIVEALILHAKESGGWKQELKKEQKA